MKRFQALKETVRVMILIGASALWAGLESQAIPLGLPNPSTAPDLMGSFQEVSYTAGNGLFQAIGYTTDYANGSASLVDIGAYTLIATITGAGVLTSGALTIGGDIGFGQETLLVGTLSTGPSGTAFGFMDPPIGGNIFEFLFTVTGGDPTVVSKFGGLGAGGGVILDAWFQNGGTPFSGLWTSDFSNDGWSGVSDSFSMSPVTAPEPSSILVTLLGAALWAGLIKVSAARSTLGTVLLRNG